MRILDFHEHLAASHMYGRKGNWIVRGFEDWGRGLNILKTWDIDND